MESTLRSKERSNGGTVEFGALNKELWSGQLGVVTLPQRGNPTRALFALIGAINIELWRGQLGADTPPQSCRLKRAPLELGALTIELCNGRLGVDTSPQRGNLKRALFGLGALNIELWGGQLEWTLRLRVVIYRRHCLSLELPT